MSTIANLTGKFPSFVCEHVMMSLICVHSRGLLLTCAEVNLLQLCETSLCTVVHWWQIHFCCMLNCLAASNYEVMTSTAIDDCRVLQHSTMWAVQLCCGSLGIMLSPVWGQRHSRA